MEIKFSCTKDSGFSHKVIVPDSEYEILTGARLRRIALSAEDAAAFDGHHHGMEQIGQFGHRAFLSEDTRFTARITESTSDDREDPICTGVIIYEGWPERPNS